MIGGEIRGGFMQQQGTMGAANGVQKIGCFGLGYDFSAIGQGDRQSWRATGGVERQARHDDDCY